MARKKTNAVPAFARTINVRVPSALEGEIKEVCKTHDLSTSHLCRKAIRFFLQSIKGKEHLYQKVTT
jgi:Arc/MetJ-type ribon-helix-helix transcriptional regulator